MRRNSSITGSMTVFLYTNTSFSYILGTAGAVYANKWISVGGSCLLSGLKNYNAILATHIVVLQVFVQDSTDKIQFVTWSSAV